MTQPARGEAAGWRLCVRAARGRAGRKLGEERQEGGSLR